MTARIVVTLVMEYAGNDTAEYDEAMAFAQAQVADVGEEVADIYEAVRVVDVQVSG
jgi:hypothetical protein